MTRSSGGVRKRRKRIQRGGERKANVDLKILTCSIGESSGRMMAPIIH